MQVRPAESSLLMTEPLFNLASIQQVTQEVVFEQFGFQSMHAVTGPELAIHDWAASNPDDATAQSLSGIVLDAGYSFTHAVPIFDGRVIKPAVRRIRLGGKLLTNLMKEWVSVLLAGGSSEIKFNRKTYKHDRSVALRLLIAYPAVHGISMVALFMLLKRRVAFFNESESE
jgi:actin-related protein